MRKPLASLHGTLLSVAFTCLQFSGPASVQADVVAIPQVAVWESQMKEFGRKACDLLQSYDTTGNGAYGLNGTYYDGQRVFFQIAAYTGDPTWKYCAGLAEKFYRDGYVYPNNGGVPGYWNFTTGLLMDYQRSNDTRSKDAVVLLSQRAAFASEAPLDWTASPDASREVAYAIVSYLNAEAVGGAVRPRKAQLIDQALGHIDQWFVSKTASYVRPFMVGLTMMALIQAHQASPDSRIPTAIGKALDGLWTRMWLPAKESFVYTDRIASDGSGGMEPSPDLNQLIAPAYAWMYLQTGNTTYRDRGDQIFVGGIKGAYLYGPKQFNQSYMMSFDYVAWRKDANAKYSGQVASTTPPDSTSTPSTVKSVTRTPSTPTPPTPTTTSKTVTAPTVITPAPKTTIQVQPSTQPVPADDPPPTPRGRGRLKFH